MWRLSFFDIDLNFIVSHVVETNYENMIDYAQRVVNLSETLIAKIVYEKLL